MSLYIREKFKDFVLAEWPPTDLTEHAFMIDCVQQAYRHKLIDLLDIQAAIRYSGGSSFQGNAGRIEKFFTVMAEYTGYTDRSFIQLFWPNDTEQSKAVKESVMGKVGLWDSKEDI